MKSKKIKKIASLAICACMITSANTSNILADSPVFDVTIPAAPTGYNYVTSNGIVYNFLKAAGNVSLGEVSVGNNKNLNLTDVVIPNTITVKGKTYAVTKIEDGAFSLNNNIKTITFGKSVKSVSAKAFLNCTALESITVASDSPYYNSDNGVLYGQGYKNLIKYPDAKSDTPCTIRSEITEINNYAFFGSSIKEISLPTTLYKIGAYSFADCAALQDVKMGTSLIEIGDYAFYKSGIKTINLSPAITKIGKSAFAFSDIIRISLPANLETIPESAFFSCTSLTELTLGLGTVSIGDYAFSNTGLSTLELSNQVKEIGKFAFSECSNLKKISLNASLSKIGDKAFYNCINIKNVNLPKTLSTLGKDVFTGCNSLESFSATNGNPANYTIEDGILYNKNTTTLIHYPAANLSTTYTLPSSLVDIEENALADCKYITEFNIEATENHFLVEDGILYDYHQTEIIKYPLGKGGSDITIPDTVEKIANKAFKNSDISGIINIPSTIKEIGEYAFEGCPNITAFNVKGGAYYTSENGVIYSADKTKLIQAPGKSVTGVFSVPSTVKEISEGAFSGLKIGTIQLNEGLEKISDYAFANTNLSEIVLPESLKEIGDYAFVNTNLSLVTFPASINSIGDYSFKSCPNLKIVKFTGTTAPETLETNAFLNCSSLEEINIPSNTSLNSYINKILALNIDNSDNLINFN